MKFDYFNNNNNNNSYKSPASTWPMLHGGASTLAAGPSSWARHNSCLWNTLLPSSGPFWRQSGAAMDAKQSHQTGRSGNAKTAHRSALLAGPRPVLRASKRRQTGPKWTETDCEKVALLLLLGQTSKQQASDRKRQTKDNKLSPKRGQSFIAVAI